MSEVISALWQSDIGQITLVSLAYSLFGVLLVGGYLSYFAGGFSVIADLSLQDILFFVPSFIAGFSELVWQEGSKWVKRVLRWVGIYMVSPFIVGLLLLICLYYLGIEKMENERLFSMGFVLWIAGLEGVVWPSRRIIKVAFWLLMVISVMILFFFAPQSGGSSGEVTLISPFIDQEIFTWSVIVEFFLLPMIIGREIARALFEQRKLLKVERCNTKVSEDCGEEVFLVALLRRWVVMYIPSASTKGGRLLLLPSEQVKSFILKAEKAKQKSA